MVQLKRGRRLVWAATAGISMVLTMVTPSAYAAKQVTKDARHDVAAISVDSLFGDYQITPAPTEASSDITRSVINHRRTRLVTKVHFRDAQPRKAPVLLLLITTPTDRYEAFYGKGQGVGGGPDFELTQGFSSDQITCKGVKLSFDLDTDVASISIPRRCLGSPRWVRMRIGSMGEEASGNFILIDDAHREGMRRDLVLVNGSRIRRG